MHKILVVDDEQRIADILESFLQKNKFEVIKVISGRKALEILDSDEIIDMMVLDMRMPEMDGVTVMEKTRDLGKDFPIIFLTGLIDEGDYSDRLRNNGFSEGDVLSKPIELCVLLEKVKQKLGIA